MKSSSPTQNDVARLAAVSHTTVSRYINNKGYISPAVRERIKAAIEELNYTPNMFAQGLKSKRSMALGVLLPDIVNPFFATIFKSVEGIAHKNGYNVILCITEENAVKEVEYLEILKTRSVDGFLVVPSPGNDYSRYRRLDGEKVVYAVRKPLMNNIICYKNDDRLALRLAVDHLIDMGHKNIGIINLPLTIPPAVERIEGYKESLREHGITVNERYIHYSPFSLEVSYRETIAMLRQRVRPTAIIPTNYALALGALRAIKYLNLRVPDDISVIGLDDFEAAALLDPPLTTVSISVKDIGAQAVTALLEQIREPSTVSSTIELAPRLMIRDSCRHL